MSCSNDLEDSAPLKERAPSNTVALKIRTAVVFCRETPDEVPWIVPGIAAMGASTELVGRPKAAGKTTYLLALAKAAVSGGVFLGAQVPRTRVLYLTEQKAARASDAQSSGRAWRTARTFISSPGVTVVTSSGQPWFPPSSDGRARTVSVC